MKKRLEIAIDAAYKAGAAVLEIYDKDFTVYTKDDLSPLTEADLKAEKIIVELIQKEFTEDLILSEESVKDIDRKKGFVWIIDPIDGTKEFIKKNDEFTINIGLINNGIPVLGVVYAPCSDELYYSIKGTGAYKIVDGEKKRLKVSYRMDQLVALNSRSHGSEEYASLLEDKRVDKIVKMGSSLKACKIAEGIGDIYYRFGRTMIWDTCAVEIILREAGGIIKTMDNEDIDYSRSDLVNYGFYVLNSIVNDLRGGQ